MLHRSAAQALVSVVLATASLTAQQATQPSLTLNQASLKSGTSVTLTYTNPAMANQVVIIDVDNGMRHGTLTAVVEITLDANGVGTGTWQVPAWLGANFNAPGIAEVHRVII